MKLPVQNNQLKVKVTPNSSKTEIKYVEDNFVKINLKAPPEKDKANKELIRFLKKEFGLKVRIKFGKSSREKILEII
jgi:uncharacterized protein (TIGR00251 family)